MNAPDRFNVRQHIVTEAAGSLPTERVEPRRAQPCNQLPPQARDLLVMASQVPDPQQRRIAIDRAIDVAKARFPELFHAPQE